MKQKEKKMLNRKARRFAKKVMQLLGMELFELHSENKKRYWTAMRQFVTFCLLDAGYSVGRVEYAIMRHRATIGQYIASRQKIEGLPEFFQIREKLEGNPEYQAALRETTEAITPLLGNPGS